MRRHQRRPHPLALARKRRAARGLTLVELLLSASLGIVMLGAAVAVLLAAGRMRRNQQLLSDANEEARTALRQVSRALSAAGAGGPVYSFMDANNTQRQRPALLFTNGMVPLNGTTMPQMPDSLTLLRYAADRRTVLVNPLAVDQVSVAPDGRQATTPGVEPEIFHDGESALITNFQFAMLVPFQRKSLGMDVDTARNVVKLDNALVPQLKTAHGEDAIERGASVFPVRVVRFSVVYVPAEGKIPERADLVMETLNPQTLLPFVPAERTVLAKDIEDFQVQWGYDRNDDGVADEGYTELGPTDNQLMDPSLTFARLTISARTSNTLVTEQGTYVVNEDTPFERGIDLGGPRPPVSGHRRRVLSTVVLLKNLVAPRI